MNVNKKYESLTLIEDKMKFLTKSEIRLKILNCLTGNSKSIKEIVNETNLTYSSVSSNVGKLNKKGCIYKKEGKYQTNHVCDVYLKNIMDFNILIKIINNFKAFWDKHNLNEINKESLMDITSLKNAKLIESTPIDIYKPHNHMKELIKDSDEIKVIFPYLHPDYPKLIEELLIKNAKVEIIIPKSIENHFFDSINQKYLKNGIKNKNLKIITIKKDLSLSLTINKENMNLGLFKADGSFDQNRLLTSNDEKSRQWAITLFNEIKSI